MLFFIVAIAYIIVSILEDDKETQDTFKFTGIFSLLVGVLFELTEIKQLLSAE